MAKDQERKGFKNDGEAPKGKRSFKKSGKGFKGSKRGNCNERPADEDGKFVPGNDFSWWNKHPELMKNAANFKSNYIAGMQISDDLPYVVPGVLEIGLKTCYYPSALATDPVNVWARDLYLRMFQKYRPASGYSASDLGITLFAELEPVKLIALYERIYGVINRYSILNVNMPFVEAEALGLSSAELTYLQGHMSDFRYDLNYLIRKAQRLCIPKDISFVADAISLLGYEYIDHNNPRGQIIVFNLKNVGVYTDAYLTTGGSVNFDDLGQGSTLYPLFDFTADNMCKALDVVLTALLGSDSVQRICADLCVWFGQSAMLEFLPIPEDYIVLPTVSESILHKMHNSVTMPGYGTNTYSSAATELTSFAIGGLSTADETAVLDGEYHIYQYNDAIVTVAALKQTAGATSTAASWNGVSGKALASTNNTVGLFHNSNIIDGYQEEPDPEFVVEGSLLKYTTKGRSTGSDSDAFLIVTSIVNWFVSEFKLHSTNANPVTMANIGPNSGSVQSLAGQLALIDWAPLTYYATANAVFAVFGDVDVIIPINSTELNKIQRTCFLSGIHTDVQVVNK